MVKIEDDVLETSSDEVVSFDLHVVAGKNTYVYDAHTYHIKVPPEGIKHLINHHTKPGDIVLYAFCGSGMTGTFLEIMICLTTANAITGLY